VTSLAHIWVPLLAYLIGSIPVAVCLGRLKFQEDVRDSGSGNPGATNVYRRWGFFWGLTVFLLDALKGVAASMLIGLVEPGPFLAVLVVACVILGHQYPVFSRFRGGRGVSTAAGCYLLHMPVLLGVGILVFGIVLATARRVSLASLLAITSILIAHTSMHMAGIAYGTTVWGTVIMWLLLLWGHRQNIRRLVAGTEPRIGRS